MPVSERGRRELRVKVPEKSGHQKTGAGYGESSRD